MATYTCSVFKGNVAKVVFKGDQSVSGLIAWPANTAVGDIALLAKVPHGATIVDFWEYHSTNQAAQVLQFGLDSGVANGGGAGLSALIAGTAAQATRNNFAPGAWKAVAGNIMPPTVSVADTAPQRYAILECQVISGTSGTMRVMFNLEYRMDGPQPRPPGAQADEP